MFLPPGTGRGFHRPPLALPLLFGVLLFFTAFIKLLYPIPALLSSKAGLAGASPCRAALRLLLERAV